ncbi:MAG: DinB family protein [Pseudomonadota bacterium]
MLGEVVEFLGLDDNTGPELSPKQLIERYDRILETAIRLTRQMPDDQLENMLPGRPRSWRVLLHHVFQIPIAYLDMEAIGETLTYENLVAPPPEDLQSSENIAKFGEATRARFHAWAETSGKLDFNAKVPTYFGDMRRHDMLERTVWHSTQHVRQVASLLEQAGIEPDRPLTKADIEGLPLTDTVWG